MSFRYRGPAPKGDQPRAVRDLVEGFYLQADYYNLSVAYGAFVLNNLTRTSPNYGRGFRISYKVDF